jgi:GAF domain-containing protein
VAVGRRVVNLEWLLPLIQRGMAISSISRPSSCENRATNARIVQIADVQNDPLALALDVMVRAGFRALLVVPLFAADRIVGALVAANPRRSGRPRSGFSRRRPMAASMLLSRWSSLRTSAMEVSPAGHPLS